MSGGEIKSCPVRTLICNITDDFQFEDKEWHSGDIDQLLFWGSIGDILLWPFVILFLSILSGFFGYFFTVAYLKIDAIKSKSEHKHDKKKPTKELTDKSEIFDPYLEHDNDGIHDSPFTITFGSIKKPP